MHKEVQFTFFHYPFKIDFSERFVEPGRALARRHLGLGLSCCAPREMIIVLLLPGEALAKQGF